MSTKLFMFDLDGTVYLSGVMIDGAARFLQRLDEAGVDYAFMTNNSSIGPGDYLSKLQRLGLKATQKNILTSAEASVLMLRELELGPELFVIGTAAYKAYLASMGFEHVEKAAKTVLVAFDPEMTYADLTTAVRLAAGGAAVVASHPDKACPSSEGIMPDAGSILAAIEAATGVKPIAIAGKPNRWIVELAMERYAVAAGEICVVGDRLDTDIKMAADNGMQSILTLTGVMNRADLAKSDVRPGMVVESIAELAEDELFVHVAAGV